MWHIVRTVGNTTTSVKGDKATIQKAFVEALAAFPEKPTANVAIDIRYRVPPIPPGAKK